MLRILFITSVSNNSNQKNMNHYQRVYFLSRLSKLYILCTRDADFSVSAGKSARYIRPKVCGKLGLFFFGVFCALSNRYKFDFVITEPSTLIIIGFLFKIFTHAKWVVDVWDIPFRANIRNNRLNWLRQKGMRLISRIIFNWTDLFIVSIVPDYELKEFKIKDNKMLLMCNAIWQDEHKKFAPNRKNTNYNIFCMRSFHTIDMGVDVLIDAFCILKKEFDDITLTIVGDLSTDLIIKLKNYTNLAGVEMVGFVAHERLRNLMESASVFVVPFLDVPDLAQTYPIKIFEYMQCGKPIVASNIAGIKKLIKDSENGLLFRAGDPRDLAFKLRKLRLDVQFADMLAKSAKENIKNYDCVLKNKIIFETLKSIK